MQDLRPRVNALLSELSSGSDCYAAGPFFILFDESKAPYAKFELSGAPWGLNLNYVEAQGERRKGKGTKAMTRLCQLADKHQIPIFLNIKEMDNPKLRTSKKILRKFYERFGFVKSTRVLTGPDYMMREPIVP